MKTAVVQIGNSDNKLTQADWAAFVQEISNCVGKWAFQLHFFSCSFGSDPWQNAAWIFEISEDKAEKIKEDLRVKAFRFNQESIAWLEGEAEFIK